MSLTIKRTKKAPVKTQVSQDKLVVELLLQIIKKLDEQDKILNSIQCQTYEPYSAYNEAIQKTTIQRQRVNSLF